MNNSVNLAGLTGLLSEYSKEIQQILIEQHQRDTQEQTTNANNGHYSATPRAKVEHQK